jgi:hypothetical protein
MVVPVRGLPVGDHRMLSSQKEVRLGFRKIRLLVDPTGNVVGVQCR